MSLIKNFLHTNLKSFEISKRKLIVGVLIGVSYSFAFYSFLYLVREGLRVMSIVENFDLWVLTDEEVNFYNLFFAFLSLIIGQSVCFSYWVDKPNKPFKKKIRRRNSIVNDLRSLNWFFLSWFAKLALVFATMVGFSSSDGYYAFSFYPDYKYLFILLIIVLYLYTWNTIQLTFKRKSYKWMLISILAISCTAFLFSKINLINYKVVDNIFKQESIHEKYHLVVPESNVYDRIRTSKETSKDIYLVNRKNQTNNNDPVIVIDEQEIELDILYFRLNDWVNKGERDDLWDKHFQLHIHEDIKMGFVNKLKKELSKTNLFRTSYAVTPLNPKYDKRYYKDHAFKIKMQNYDYSINPSFNYEELIAKYSNIIKINQEESDVFYINDSHVEVYEIKKTIKNLIQEEPNYIIKFYINDEDNFSSYFKVLSFTKEAIDDLRNEYYLKEKIKEKKGEFYDATKELTKKYPYRIYEVTKEMIESLESQKE